VILLPYRQRRIFQRGLFVYGLSSQAQNGMASIGLMKTALLSSNACFMVAVSYLYLIAAAVFGEVKGCVGGDQQLAAV